MDLTYSTCAKLLANFLRKQDFHSFDGANPPGVGALLAAVAHGTGDFAGRLEDLPSGDVPIAQSLWYRRAEQPDPLPEPPLFSFDDGLSLAGTLALAVPQVGVEASGAVNAAQDVLANLKSRAEWAEKLRTVDNPAADPYEHVITALSGKIDSSGVHRDLRAVLSRARALQNSLREFVRSPGEVARIAPGAARHAVALKTRPGLTRAYVLDALGKVFELLDSPEWLEIASTRQDERPLDGELADNPYYQDATLTAFLHVSLTAVSALQAYVLLYPLPDSAFRPGWDGRAADGSEVDVVAALRAGADQAGEPELPATGWTALNRLFDLVDPAGTGNLPARLARVRDVWLRIFARLTATELSTGAPALRDGLWYLPADTSRDREVTAADFAGNGDDLRTRVFTTESCEGGQVVFRDGKLRQEPFVAKFAHFHTTLSLNWSASVTGDDGVTGVLEKVGVGVAGVLIPWIGAAAATATAEGTLLTWQHTLNADYPAVRYPRSDGATPDDGYDDVFWTAASTDDGALADAATGHFLAVAQGRDVLGYLGLLLTRYCADYGFGADLDNDLNPAGFAALCGELFTAVAASAGELLGVTADQTDRAAAAEAVRA